MLLKCFLLSATIDRKFTECSLSEELQSRFNVLSTYFKKELSLDAFYDPEKINDNKFDEIYAYYVKLVQEFELVIENYIKVSRFFMKKS